MLLARAAAGTAPKSTVFVLRMREAQLAEAVEPGAVWVRPVAAP